MNPQDIAKLLESLDRIAASLEEIANHLDDLHCSTGPIEDELHNVVEAIKLTIS